MDKLQIIGIIVVALVGLGGLAFFLLQRAGTSGQNDIRGLRAGAPDAPQRAGGRSGRPDPADIDIDAIKRQAGQIPARGKEDEITTKLFRAGFFTLDDRQRFMRTRIGCMAGGVLISPIALFLITHKPPMVIIGALLGAFIGFSLPISWLERQIRRREDEVLYYLPLVIEQVSIGVSSALDVGPCIAQIVSMAQERDSHNPVTEMFVHVEKLMRSGLNLEDALSEVATANGMTEVKHAFMFLAQCARHGGEVSRQLQELADSVMMQRQVQVEAKITGLPVKATGPLALVFAGFFALLGSGLVVNMMNAFGK